MPGVAFTGGRRQPQLFPAVSFRMFLYINSEPRTCPLGLGGMMACVYVYYRARKAQKEGVQEVKRSKKHQFVRLPMRNNAEYLLGLLTAIGDSRHFKTACPSFTPNSG